jgi:cell division protein ZapA
MAVAVVTVAGRTYRVGCEEGQEQRLEELAAVLDQKVAGMRKNFGEIGDQRMIVMAALETADEAADAKSRVDELQGEVEALRAKIDALDAREAALEARLARAFEEAASRLERLAEELARSDAELDLP